MYNILLGGAAGDGIETMTMLLERILKKSGFYVFTFRDVMSRVRGGHNFVQVRFGGKPISSHTETLDGMFAMNEEACRLHCDAVRLDGFIMTDISQSDDDSRKLRLPLLENAKTAGNIKTVTSVAIGAILSLFRIELTGIREILEASLTPSLVEANFAAIQKGYTLTAPQFKEERSDLYNHIQISGIEALALGAAAAGLKFYSAYPMSPSTGILEYLSAHSEELEIVAEQAEDEIAAVNMAIGAAYSGALAMTGTSGGGFCLMTEALGFAGMAEIGIVIVDVQRPGPATGLPTRTEQSDLKFVISASQGEFPRMVIALRNHEDSFYQTARALRISKKYQIPVILLSDQYLADSTATIPVFDTNKLYVDNSEGKKEVSNPYKSYEITQDGISSRPIPGNGKELIRIDSDEHDEYGLITESALVRKQMMDKRMGKQKLLETEVIEPEFLGSGQCDTLIVGFGSSYGAIKEAVDILNEQDGRYGALIFGDIFPLPTTLLKRFANRSGKVICVEQNATGQLASLIRETTSINCNQSILKYDGRQLSADYIMQGIKSMQGRRN